MCAIHGIFLTIKKFLFILPLGLLFALPAHAVLINFDDLEYIPSHPDFDHFSDHPVTDEYLDQGLRIVDSYLAEWWDDSEWLVSGPNYLMAGHSPSLVFVGDILPVFVSMYVTALGGDAGYLRAYGPDGWTELQQTPGEAGPATQPFKGKNFVSFYSPNGIESIEMWSFWGSRVSLAIDDLTYEYSVPAPSPLLLLVMGWLALMMRNRLRLAGARYR
ncbi:hypothetical protein ACSV5M_08780 [Cellvibrio sp. ARAG 10.3]|uniref:hypothetical protein n=1 Tax=Cellvibrio sp. ARAG 10.3 TaxID=3451358 RepID=UPI003F48CB5B